MSKNTALTGVIETSQALVGGNVITKGMRKSIMAKHAWLDVRQGPEGMFNYGKRKCKNCNKEQTKHADHSWGRVTGYSWSPLVGRCNPKKEVEE